MMQTQPRLDIFVARPDKTIWPVPGVYGGKELLRKDGWQVEVHDAFLQMSSGQIAEILNRPGVSPSEYWCVVYVFIHTLDTRYRDTWFESINGHIGDIKREHPTSKWGVMGYLTASEGFDPNTVFHHADVIFDKDYDSFCDLPVVAGRRSAPLAYGHRKSADFKPANGFRWNAAYQMIDVVQCTALCGNCPADPRSCQPMVQAAQFSISSSMAALELDFLKLDRPRNLSLAYNPLTLNGESLERVMDFVDGPHVRQNIEIHFNLNIHSFTQHPRWLEFLRSMRFGSCHIEVSAGHSQGQRAIGVPEVAIAQRLADLRQAVGPTTFVFITLTVGLPGDDLPGLIRLLDSVASIVDSVKLVSASVFVGTPLAKHPDYAFDLSRRDRFGCAAWQLPHFSKSEFNAWHAQWHARQLMRPEYRVYGLHSANILFASETGYASDQVRSDLTASHRLGDSGHWLDGELRARESALLDRYIACYPQ